MPPTVHTAITSVAPCAWIAREEDQLVPADLAEGDGPGRLSVRGPHDLAMRDLEILQPREAASSDDRDHVPLSA
jgi:hypothetical protein